MKKQCTDISAIIALLGHLTLLPFHPDEANMNMKLMKLPEYETNEQVSGLSFSD